MKLRGMLVLAAMASIVACASRPMPTARVGSAEAAVRAARDVGAERVPPAAAHLRMAQDQLRRARTLVQDGEYEQAEWLLVRSETDAELAVALAREAQHRALADQTAARLRNVSATSATP